MQRKRFPIPASDPYTGLVSNGPRQANAETGWPRLITWLAGGLVFLLTAIGLIDWWYQKHKEQRFDRLILRLSQHYDVDPALVKAVVWRESKFNPKVRGRAGEIGLMQIRSLAAQEWAQAEIRRRSFEGNLFEPETNLRVGTWYLGKLLKRYARTDYPVPYALADYNAGRSNLLRWNKGPAQTNSAVFVSQIGFPGTKDYVRAVLERSAKYREELR